MRFGGNDDSVLERLSWLRDDFGPAFGKALRSGDGIPLKHLVARGLTMGDEMHQRNVACSGLILRELAPALARTSSDNEELAKIFLVFSMNMTHVLPCFFLFFFILLTY